MRTHLVTALYLSGLWAWQVGNCQHSAVASPLPTKTLDLSSGKVLLGLPPSTVMGYPLRCSSDGTLFVEVYADSNRRNVNLVPDLFSISDHLDVKRLNRQLPTGYKRVYVRSMFPGEHVIASLVEGYGKIDPAGSGDPNGKSYFIATTDRIGGSSKLIELDLKFEPLKVAILDSGKFIVLGIDLQNIVPLLALLNEDGSLSRMIDLDNRGYDGSSELDHIYSGRADEATTTSRRLKIAGALSRASLVPFGSKILLVQAGSLLPVYVLSDSGEESAITVSLPAGMLIDDILGSDHNETWIVRTQSLDSYQKFQKDHIVQNPDQRLFEVDSRTGKTLRSLAVKGPQVAEVSCAANKKLSSIYYDPKQPSDADTDQLILAESPR